MKVIEKVFVDPAIDSVEDRRWFINNVLIGNLAEMPESLAHEGRMSFIEFKNKYKTWLALSFKEYEYRKVYHTIFEKRWCRKETAL